MCMDQFVSLSPSFKGLKLTCVCELFVDVFVVHQLDVIVLLAAR